MGVFGRGEPRAYGQALGDAVRLRINQGSDVAVRRVHVVGPRWVLKTSSGKVARGANRDKYLAEV